MALHNLTLFLISLHLLQPHSSHTGFLKYARQLWTLLDMVLATYFTRFCWIHTQGQNESYDMSMLNFIDNAKWFSSVVLPIYAFTHDVGELLSLHIFAKNSNCQSFYFQPPGGCVVNPFAGLLLYLQLPVRLDIVLIYLFSTWHHYQDVLFVTEEKPEIAFPRTSCLILD